LRAASSLAFSSALFRGVANAWCTGVVLCDEQTDDESDLIHSITPWGQSRHLSERTQQSLSVVFLLVSYFNVWLFNFVLYSWHDEEINTLCLIRWMRTSSYSF
ncbi:hypothetical protein BAE44_0017218, partial [Dichanthelium oligosanthes]